MLHAHLLPSVQSRLPPFCLNRALCYYIHQVSISLSAAPEACQLTFNSVTVLVMAVYIMSEAKPDPTLARRAEKRRSPQEPAESRLHTHCKRTGQRGRHHELREDCFRASSRRGLPTSFAATAPAAPAYSGTFTPFPLRPAI